MAEKRQTIVLLQSTWEAKEEDQERRPPAPPADPVPDPACVRPCYALSSCRNDDVDVDDDECPSVAIWAQETAVRFSPQALNTAYWLPNYSTSLVLKACL